MFPEKQEGPEGAPQADKGGKQQEAHHHSIYVERRTFARCVVSYCAKL